MTFFVTDKGPLTGFALKGTMGFIVDCWANDWAGKTKMPAKLNAKNEKRIFFCIDYSFNINSRLTVIYERLKRHELFNFARKVKPREQNYSSQWKEK